MDLFLPMKGKTGSHQPSKKKFFQEFIDFRNKEKDSFRRGVYEGNITVEITFHFSDKYRGDLDNLLKSLFDALQGAKIIKNDSQIRKAIVEIKEFEPFEGIALILRYYRE